MNILIENFESRVRNVIGIDAEFLPDEDIKKDEYQYLSQKYVLNALKNLSEEILEKEIKTIHIAIVYMCGSLICNSIQIKMPSRVKTYMEEYQLSTINFKNLEDNLRAKTDSLINEILVENGESSAKSFYSYFGIFN